MSEDLPEMDAKRPAGVICPARRYVLPRVGKDFSSWRGKLMKASGKTDIGGFSLLELMIAVAIVATLAAVAVPAYYNHMMRSRQSAVVGELMSIKAAQERYYADNGGYAGRMNLLEAGRGKEKARRDINDMYAVGGTYTNGDYRYWITSSTNNLLITVGTISADGDPNHDGNFTDAWEVSIQDLNAKPKCTASNEGFAWEKLGLGQLFK
jgi:prepilin-type N-terminal cleavage/methylation domain-containing protein